ncbi:glycoside hydrolase family 71 protein [Sclerotinia borealis F-4128]|uniref:Glycoside hydrolase family 71 protein n=1 Tax=Sclerotinia borealis (strain F-4128) TaxID=1432307 RepID=W9CSF4_SCLBF|nr:glycoside hydrolase family 71 protein [Sclerotinia borealis F-4128]
MHLSLLSMLASSSLVLARNVPRNSFQSGRDVGLSGWSVQSDVCPVGSTSCGITASGACCPSSMICAKPANSEVAACCPTTGECRAVIEAAPKCADAGWSLWAGLDGNDFCCEVGLLGAYDHISHRAGTCVASVVAPTTSAVLRSTGTDSSIVATISSISTTITSAPITSTIVPTTDSVTSITSVKVSTSASSSAKDISDNIQALASSASGTTEVSSSKAATSIISKVSSSAVANSKSASNNVIASSNSAPTGKPVFFHYMVGGITDSHCERDIIDAVALGADAFALNLAVPLDSSHSWAVNTVACLFKYAQAHDFKLFFSFDMTGFTSPSQLIPILNTYITNSAYYTYSDSGQPFVSTFNGGTSAFKFGQDTVNDGWKKGLQEPMSASGHPIYFIPSFQDVAPSSSFFTTTYPTLNGTFNWNSWPTYTAGDVPVNTIDDTIYQTAAQASKKGFMMGISPLQFKHISKTQNWYRRGEANLEFRFQQILTLQPDFIEFQTWNDAGESHYMGNSWPESLVSNSTPEALSSLDYDHTAYAQILKSFIKVWKSGAKSTDTMVPTNGKDVQGTFWHHTLLKGGDCGGDKLGLGKPDGIEGVEDSVTAVVLVAEGVEGLVGRISVGGKVWGEKTLSEGFNTLVVGNITTGSVSMSVVDKAGLVVVGGKGPMDVVSKADLCNYNFQVVGLS